MRQEFKLGDVVRIKSWEQLVNEFGFTSGGYIDCNYVFVDEMRPLCGIVLTITHLGRDQIQGIKFGDTEYTISFDMIEPFQEAPKNRLHIEYYEGLREKLLFSLGVLDKRLANLRK